MPDNNGYSKPGKKSKPAIPNVDIGTRGELVWINIDDLVINHAYQRKVSRTGEVLIKKIIQNFHWSKMQPLQVCKAKRENKYYVIDGQHRVLALLELNIDEIPCYCAFEADEGSQALAFISINKNRVQMTAIAQHHAQVGAGDQNAIKIQKCCDDAGVVLPQTVKSGGDMGYNETQAVSKIGSLIRITGHENMVETFQIIMKAFPNRYSLRSGLIDAVAKVWKMIVMDGNKSEETMKAMILALKGNEPEGWIMVSRNNAENYQISTAKAMLNAVIGAFNRQVNKNERITTSV